MRHAEGIRQEAPKIRYHMERRRVVERAAEREQWAPRIDIQFEKHVEETVRELKVRDVLGHQSEGWQHNPGAGANAKGSRQDSGAGWQGRPLSKNTISHARKEKRWPVEKRAHTVGATLSRYAGEA